MRLSVVCLIMLVLCLPALADPVDPDPNGIGIYFDPGAGAESWCADALPGEQVTAYLCLTRASDTSGFTAWEGRIEVSTGGSLAAFVMQGQATNAAVEPEFVVDFAVPLPYQISTVLLDITVDVNWEWPIGLRVWPATNPRGGLNLPAYEAASAPGTFHTLGYSYGWDPVTEIPAWMAAINDDTCLDNIELPVGTVSWGSLKALYRD